MRALSIRQPFAELILRGIKTVEYRSRATHIIGEPFYIYAAKRSAGAAGRPGKTVWSRDLAGGQGLPAWMVELAEQVRLIEPGALLPTGVIVGTAVIEKCVPLTAHGLEPPHFAWHLAEARRAPRLRQPARMPQPVWFRPF